MQLINLLSKKARENFKGVSTTELLCPNFTINNSCLTKTDIEKLNTIREAYQAYAAENIERLQVTGTRDAGVHLMKLMKPYKEERLITLFLDTKNKVIKQEEIFIGTANSSTAHPREIFKKAVQYSAARIIVAHNHPSGDTEPSQADLIFTKRMIEAGEIIGISLLDHFIIGDNFNSLRESTHLVFEP